MNAPRVSVNILRKETAEAGVFSGKNEKKTADQRTGLPLPLLTEIFNAVPGAPWRRFSFS
jgi:hypothetical protein